MGMIFRWEIAQEIEQEYVRMETSEECPRGGLSGEGDHGEGCGRLR